MNLSELLTLDHALTLMKNGKLFDGMNLLQKLLDGGYRKKL